KAFARVRAQGNGRHVEAPTHAAGVYEINEINEESPPVRPAPPDERNELNEESPSYLLVTDAAGLAMLRTALDSTALLGLDLETTGLNPRTDRVRLLSLACDTIDGGTFAYLVDCFAVDPAALWDVLAYKELVIHNGAFDLSFLAQMGFTPTGRVRDTMLAAQL